MVPNANDGRAAPRVLYVDDNVVNLRVVAAMLEALGIAVSCCISPAEALELLEREAFDIIFTDIHMPEMSGFDVLREIRLRKGPNRGAPVVALTADLTRDEAQYRELGFDGFVSKPVTLRPLSEVLLLVLSPRGRASAARDPGASAVAT
ncbi:response regulator [Phenylobacterium sp. LjRoot225]|uniref:response regulator n=1 Tax=Phenylobacterium sp. LjRoot225 TaxID=3342285 RepID=UPI003ECED13E